MRDYYIAGRIQNKQLGRAGDSELTKEKIVRLFISNWPLEPHQEKMNRLSLFIRLSSVQHPPHTIQRNILSLYVDVKDIQTSSLDAGIIYT